MSKSWRSVGEAYDGRIESNRIILQNTSTPNLSRGSGLAGFALFLLIGATAAMYGPTIPAFRSTFHVTAATAGLLLSGHFAGSLAGTLTPGLVARRFRAPRLVAAVSMVCFALGCLCIAAAPGWPVAVAGAVIEGAGWGGLVIVFNALFTSGFGSRSPAALTLLNALYGVGAIIGPAGVGLLAGGQFRGPFLTAAVAALVLLPVTLALPNSDLENRASGEAHVQPIANLPLLLAAFMAAFFLYGGLEGGISAWEATHLVATGLSAAAAATITSLFWAAFTTGRLLAAPVSLRVKPERLALGGLAVLLLVMPLARVTAVTAAAYTACGLALAPVFPLMLVWAGRIMRTSQRITSFVIAADLLGGVVITALLGRLITGFSADVVPIALAALATGQFCILIAIQIFLTRRKETTQIGSLRW
jgi:FHS family glucose/mannose:H+ symporter-like MFS transporter